MRFGSLFLLSALLAARADEKPADPKPEALVSALATDDPKAREKAVEALLKAGKEVEDPLVAALKDKDPRIASGAREVLPRRAGLPPMTLSSNGVLCSAIRSPDGGWTVLATRDGKPLWQGAIVFDGGRQPTQIREMDLIREDDDPSAPPAVQVVTDAGVCRWGRDSGQVLACEGFEENERPGMSNPEPVHPLGESVKTRLELALPQGKLTAVSERPDGLGPWKVTCVPEGGKPLWEAALPRGHHFERIEVAAGAGAPVVVLTGQRTVLIDSASGDLTDQGRN